MNVMNLARFLGWASLGAGVLRFAGARRIAVGLGMPGRAGLVRGSGVREVATGLAILSSPGTAPLVWARVGGKVVDLAALSVTPAFGPAERRKVKATAALLFGAAMLDLYCARRLGERRARRRTYRDWD